MSQEVCNDCYFKREGYCYIKRQITAPTENSCVHYVSRKDLIKKREAREKQLKELKRIQN